MLYDGDGEGEDADESAHVGLESGRNVASSGPFAEEVVEVVDQGGEGVGEFVTVAVIVVVVAEGAVRGAA